MTGYNLEPMELSKCCVSSSEMLGQVFSCCLFVGLSASVLSSVTEHLLVQVIDFATEEYPVSLP